MYQIFWIVLNPGYNHDNLSLYNVTLNVVFMERIQGITTLNSHGSVQLSSLCRTDFLMWSERNFRENCYFGALLSFVKEK